jgi:hypothetical protein
MKLYILIIYFFYIKSKYILEWTIETLAKKVSDLIHENYFKDVNLTDFGEYSNNAFGIVNLKANSNESIVDEMLNISVEATKDEEKSIKTPNCILNIISEIGSLFCDFSNENVQFDSIKILNNSDNQDIEFILGNYNTNIEICNDNYNDNYTDNTDNTDNSWEEEFESINYNDNNSDNTDNNIEVFESNNFNDNNSDNIDNINIDNKTNTPIIPDDPDDPVGQKSNGLSGGAIAGIVIGVVVFVVIIAIITYILIKKYLLYNNNKNSNVRIDDKMKIPNDSDSIRNTKEIDNLYYNEEPKINIENKIQNEIVKCSESCLGSRKWALCALRKSEDGKFKFNPGEPKCSLFVYEMLTKAGVTQESPDQPGIQVGIFNQSENRPYTAKEWHNQEVPKMQLIGCGADGLNDCLPGDIITDGSYIGIISDKKEKLTFSASSQEIIEDDWGWREEDYPKIKIFRYEP